MPAPTVQVFKAQERDQSRRRRRSWQARQSPADSRAAAELSLTWRPFVAAAGASATCAGSSGAPLVAAPLAVTDGAPPSLASAASSRSTSAAFRPLGSRPRSSSSSRSS